MVALGSPGQAKTLRLPEKVVELGWVERVSVMTVQRTLKKTNCSLIGRSIGGSRPGAAPRSLHGGRFRSLCPSEPPSSGGLHGETNKQLIGEVREPLPVAPGQPERVEHEYVRNGVAQIFLEV